MGADSSIEWTRHTFNPWVGCQRVSPGCEHCYAESYDKRVGGGVNLDGVKRLRWGPKAERVRTSEANWRKPLQWNAAAEKAGERHRVFCSSLADVFEDREELAPWRLDLFHLIRQTPHLDWLLLSKRPENAMRLIGRAAFSFPPVFARHAGTTAYMLARWLQGEPPPNVWLGATAEDQQRADHRGRELVSIPAAIHFFSCEPLLEKVEIWAPVDWVIVGGESGPGARPFDVGWARALVEHAHDEDRHGFAVFVKQLGSNPVLSTRDWLLRDRHGGDWNEWPADLRVREYPQVRR